MSTDGGGEYLIPYERWRHLSFLLPCDFYAASGWNSLEQSASGPRTSVLVIQLIQTVTDDVLYVRGAYFCLGHHVN